jgi:hypothetical protein
MNKNIRERVKKGERTLEKKYQRLWKKKMLVGCPGVAKNVVCWPHPQCPLLTITHTQSYFNGHTLYVLKVCFFPLVVFFIFFYLFFSLLFTLFAHKIDYQKKKYRYNQVHYEMP